MKEIEVFRKKIQAGEQLIGAAITLDDPITTELVTRHMDFVWIDMEHGALGVKQVERHILSAKKNGKVTLVRVPGLDMCWIKGVLDAGAHGVIIPQLYTPEDFHLCVEFGRYIPEGKRGFGPRMPYEQEKMGSMKDYLEWANKNIYIAPQIETKESYEALDEILTIKGYDSLCIGPVDLAISMGFYGEVLNPVMLKVYEDIIKRAKQANVQVGIGMGINTDFARTVLGYGADWLQIGSDFDFINKLAADLYVSLNK